MTGMHMMFFQNGYVPHTVVISPDDLSQGLSNGATYSQSMTANVTGGIGPFTYVWSITSGLGFTLTSTTSNPTTLQHSGLTDMDRAVTVQVVVTDTGASGSPTASDTASGTVTWGTPP